MLCDIIDRHFVKCIVPKINLEYKGKNKESPEQAPGYLRFLLEIFAYVGEQIPYAFT
jgi:hypothetical protein